MKNPQDTHIHASNKVATYQPYFANLGRYVYKNEWQRSTDLANCSVNYLVDWNCMHSESRHSDYRVASIGWTQFRCSCMPQPHSSACRGGHIRNKRQEGIDGRTYLACLPLVDSGGCTRCSKQVRSRRSWTIAGISSPFENDNLSNPLIVSTLPFKNPTIKICGLALYVLSRFLGYMRIRTLVCVQSCS